MGEAGVSALKRVPLFSGLSDKDLKRVGEMLQESVFSAGDEIAIEGEGGGLFFLIESGSATVTLEGRQVSKLGPGDWFGELALIAKGPRTATVTANDELRCRTLASFQFRPFVKEHAEVAWPILQALAERLGEAESR